MKDIYVAYAVLLELSYKFNYNKIKIRYFKTKFELNVLNRIFKLNGYPSRKTKYEICCFLHMPYRSVEVFFQNRRAILKKRGITTMWNTSKITYDIIISIIEDEIINSNKP